MFATLNKLNVRSGLLTARITNAFPNDLKEFPVGINKPIRKLMKVSQLNPGGSTLNQNKNSDVGNNQGQRWFRNVPTSRTDTQI